MDFKIKAIYEFYFKTKRLMPEDRVYAAVACSRYSNDFEDCSYIEELENFLRKYKINE